MRHGQVAGVAALLAALLPSMARAASCTVSAQPLTFGAYDPLAILPVDGIGQVSVNCSNPLSLLLTYRVALSAGSSGSFAGRTLAAGANRLGYNLYTDVARLLVWGDGSAGTTRITNAYLVAAGGVTATHSVYGRVPAGQNVATGEYADIITVTVEY